MRVLILEDDPLLLLDLQDLVEEGGHEAVTCPTLSAMRDRLADVFDFAFLDVDLPDGKSFDMATRLCERGVPFAFVSASRQSEMPAHLRHVRFIAKPFLGITIRNALRPDRRLAS